MKKLIESIDLKKLKYILICTLVFMVITHGYCYTNLNFSHDSMRTYFWTKLDTIEIGRYMIPFFLILRGKYYPPLIVGFLTYIFISLTVYLLVDIFKIKNKISILLTSGIMATASTLTLLNATYLDFSDIYTFCILLMTFAAYLWRNYKRGYLYAIIPIFIGLGLYQSYICFFIGIVMLISIKDIVENKKNKEIFINGLKSILALIISLILYAISLKVVTAVTGIALSNTYNSVAGVGDFGSLSNLLNLIKGTYEKTYFYIANPSTYYKHVIAIINLLLTVISSGLALFYLKKNKATKENKMLFLGLLLLLPFGINVVYLLGKGVEHQLMIYSLFLLYIFALVLTEKFTQEKKLQNKKITKFLSYFVNFSFAVIIISGVIYANQCYLKKNLEFDATLTTMNRVIDRIEQIEGYEVGVTEVAIVGNLQNSTISTKRPAFDYESVGLEPNFSATYYRSYDQYFKNYLSYPLNLLPEEKMKEISQKEEVKEMNIFPYKDYAKIIDDVLVIKLSEVRN